MMAGAVESHPTIDGRRFRDVVGRLPSGVAVITTANAEGRFGMTASSVTSVSADPATVLVCLNNAIPSARAVAQVGRFAINVLDERHGELAYRFAAPSTDKFAGVAVREGLLGLPLLNDGLAHIECEVSDQLVSGTHTIFIGRVVAADAAEGKPLTYFRGGFGRFAHSRDETVYRMVRESLLARHHQVDERLEVPQLAETLQVEEESVFYALTRLSGDGLVRRELDGTYTVSPFDVRSSDAAYDAQLLIELGVIEAVVGSVPEAALSDLRSRFDAMARLFEDDHFVDFDGYLDANRRFHEGLVGLASSTLLSSLFDGLAIKQVMTRRFSPITNTSHLFIAAQRELLEAVEAGNKESAKHAATIYSTLAKTRVHEALERDGSTA